LSAFNAPWVGPRNNAYAREYVRRLGEDRSPPRGRKRDQYGNSIPDPFPMSPPRPDTPPRVDTDELSAPKPKKQSKRKRPDFLESKEPRRSKRLAAGDETSSNLSDAPQL
jgi:hypothetical protein